MSSVNIRAACEVLKLRIRSSGEVSAIRDATLDAKFRSARLLLGGPAFVFGKGFSLLEKSVYNRHAASRTLHKEHQLSESSAQILVPPFTRETATEKVRLAENGWNSRDPHKVCLAYTVDSWWRNRSEFVKGREQIIEFLTEKWRKEIEYRLIKQLWAFDGENIAVRFAYEWHDESGYWFRSYGNENWEFDAHGLMSHRHASINDLPIQETERLFHWSQGPRPAEHPGLSDLGL